MFRFGKPDIAAVVFATVLAGLTLTSASAVIKPLASAAAAAIIVVWIAVKDLISLQIPDGGTIALAILGLADRLASATLLPGEPWTTLAIASLDAVLCGGSLFLIREAFFRRRGYDGLGLGDVKLAAAAGILCGTFAFFWALLAASVAGIAIFLISGLHRDRLARLPLGALLAPACLIAWMMQR